MKKRSRVPAIVVVSLAAVAVPLVVLAVLAVQPEPTPVPVAAGLALAGLLMAVPGSAVVHLAIRQRRAAQRRALLLSTAVEVSHAVGSTLDQIEVFRQTYEQVRSVMPVDAFYVAIADRDRKVIQYRFLVDESRELPPTENDMEGTLAGACVERGAPILMRDAERERPRYVPRRVGWGTVVERSIMVAPLRIRGEIVGAISTQSVHLNAYDSEDVELLVDIANEAAIAIERSELHQRTYDLSQRLVALHRVGVDLVSQRDLGQLARKLADAAGELLGARAAVYVDRGGEVLVRADDQGPAPEGQGFHTISKRSGPTARVLASGEPIEIGSPEELPDEARELLLRAGQRSVLIQPLRSAEETVGVLYVAWPEPHRFTVEERELVGIVAGIGGTALRSLRLYDELEDAYLSTVTTLTATIQAREGYREDHLRNVAADAVALGQRLGLSDDLLRSLRYAALFHSLGKIAIPASILSKPGILTPDEMRLVHDHPILGAQIVGEMRFLKDVSPIVRHANERWDGDGYPDGLAGEAIPRLSRILHIVIAFNALRADRPYRPGIPVAPALMQLRAEAGTRFDPLLADAFAEMIEARGAVAEAETELSAARELAILSEITPTFHTPLDVQQTLERVLRVLERRMPGARIGAFLVDAESGDLVLRASAGQWPAAVQRRPPDVGIMGWVLEHGTAEILEDVRHDTRFVPLGDDSRSGLIVPLIAGGRARGVLAILHPAAGAFGQRDLTLMQAVGAQVAASIEVAGLHERLKLAASTDALTGIHNYRYFWDRLQEEVSRAERRETPLSIAYFDIDGLKLVNDRYGHLAGDAVLRTLGRVIGEHVRGEDVPARYGGDEFAIVMPETPKEEAEKAVQRLMTLLDAAEVQLEDGTKIPMPGRSWGVSTYPVDARTAKELVDGADRLAYAQKRGR